MQLITSPRPAPIQPSTNQPWALAIKARYGELPAFALKFTPAVQTYCAANVRRAVERDLPTFGRMVRTYGEDGMASVMATHITDAVLRMGEDRDVDPADIRFAAQAICQSERFRLLRFTTLFAFFHLLKCGEFEIYGKVTPRKILDALRKYAVEAQSRENRIAAELEHDRAEQARREYEANAISWGQYAASRNIADTTLAAHIGRHLAGAPQQ